MVGDLIMPCNTRSACQFRAFLRPVQIRMGSRKQQRTFVFRYDVVQVMGGTGVKENQGSDCLVMSPSDAVS